MIAVTQNMAFGIQVDPVAVAQAKPTVDPSTPAADGGFWQAIAQIDAATEPKDSALIWPAEIATTERLLENIPDKSVDQPNFDSVLLPVTIPLFALTPLPAAPPKYLVDPEQPVGQTTQIAAVLTDPDPALVVDATFMSPDASAADANANPVADAAPVAPNAKDGDSSNLPASTGLPSIAATAPKAAIPVTCELASPPNAHSAAAPEGEKKPPLIMAHSLPSPAAAQTASPDQPALQSASIALSDAKFAPLSKATKRGSDDTLLPPIVTASAVGNARLSIAENVWRAHWGGHDLGAKADISADIKSQPHLPDAAALPLTGASKAWGLGSSSVADLKDEFPVLPNGDANGRSPFPNGQAKLKDTNTPSPILADAPATAGLDIDPDAVVPLPSGLMQTDSVIASAAATNTAPLTPASSPTPIIATNLTPVVIEMTKIGNDGPFELALAPEELGRLTISIRQEGDFVRVSMLAERPETLDLLRRHASDLLADLRQSGFSGASFSFGQSGQDPALQFAEAPVVEDDPPPQQFVSADQKPSPPSRSHKGAGLDLRL